MLSALIPVMLALTAPQTVNDAFVGRWVAEFKGTAHIRLELRRSGETLLGSISLGNMRVDANGDVIEVGEARATMRPIRDIVARAASISFVHMDDNDADRFELRLDGDGALLHFVLNEEDRKDLQAEGIPPPRPVRLRRVP